jgi:polar amino acid transport system substrate-binding protein
MKQLLRFKAGRPGAAIIVAILLVLALGLLTAACGSSSSTSTSASPAAGVNVAGVTVTPDKTLEALVPPAVKSAGVLRVASNIPYPPFEMWVNGSSGQVTGFDYDLGQALSAKLGLKFQFLNLPFESLIPAVDAGKADIILAAMVDNKTREQAVNFVDYAKVGSVLLTLKGNPYHLTTLDSLAGKTVAAQAGTIQAQMLETLKHQLATKGKPPLSVLTFPQDSDALLAVKAGKAVADFVQLPNAEYTAKTADGGGVFQVVVDPASPGGYAPSIIGAAVAKSNTQLTDAIQKTLQALIDDGTYTKILTKYGLEGGAVTSAQVNQG